MVTASNWLPFSYEFWLFVLSVCFLWYTHSVNVVFASVLYGHTSHLKFKLCEAHLSFITVTIPCPFWVVCLIQHCLPQPSSSVKRKSSCLPFCQFHTDLQVTQSHRFRVYLSHSCGVPCGVNDPWASKSWSRAPKWRHLVQPMTLLAVWGLLEKHRPGPNRASWWWGNSVSFSLSPKPNDFL